MSKRDGGPAYPVCAEGGVNNALEPHLELGMSLRDWFAGQALAGGLGRPTTSKSDWQRDIAWCAYAIADAMLTERAKDDPS